VHSVPNLGKIAGTVQPTIFKPGGVTIIVTPEGNMEVLKGYPFWLLGIAVGLLNFADQA